MLIHFVSDVIRSEQVRLRLLANPAAVCLEYGVSNTQMLQVIRGDIDDLMAHLRVELHSELDRVGAYCYAGEIPSDAPTVPAENPADGVANAITTSSMSASIRIPSA